MDPRTRRQQVVPPLLTKQASVHSDEQHGWSLPGSETFGGHFNVSSGPKVADEQNSISP